MIAPLLKARIVFIKDDLNKVLKELQLSSCIMILNQDNNASKFVSNDGKIQRVGNSIKVINSFAPKQGLIKEEVNASLDELTNNNEESLEIINKIENLVDQKNQNFSLIKNLEDEYKQYLPWKMLDVKLNLIKNTKSTCVHVGFIDLKNKDKLENYINENNLLFNCFDSIGNQIPFVIYNFIDDEQEVSQFLKLIGFNKVLLPDNDLFMSDYLTSLMNKKDSLVKENNNIDEQLKLIAHDINSLKIYEDFLINQKKLNNSEFGESSLVYYIDGWVQKDNVSLLESSMKKATDVFDIEYHEPTEEDDVPTELVNNKFVKPFESITNMFSIPSWKEIDPNPIMSIWYWFLFGMMMGDFGYGVILCIGALLFIKILKPKKGTLNLAKVLLYSSIPTMLWGIIFNSYFGASLPFYEALVSPMEDAIPMLILSVAVGALHIITGLIMKMIRDIIAKDFLEMLGKDLSWIFILIGIGGFAASMFVASLSMLKIPMIVLIILGVTLILLFAGHSKKGIIGKALGGVLGLYDVTSYLGDLLSYTRIMALVMSSASVAMVMNLLAGMVQGSPIGWIFSIIIYIVGHIFNLVLGLLSAYVHDCRLQYIEFYGKFYDGGGKLFKPLAVETKNVDNIK